ncbi:hypothetical protein CDO52_03390 [Nocardiopsis gilva YIM 90087]|uniref:WbqC family protein n=2 Tax=Nocardiopsis gilva TaxID=280236 RepID=A0A223S1E1_9ACTN|nr:WbqC family protein [Nocardiopsis gilva]ASU81950.1 hypothetical protein CDO52_03390 [Nocardiopsis gilva YIM 90087]
MRVAMHQPHYLPWLGLIDKIDRCDLFVVLDHVQYERRGWQNRNYVASKSGPVLLSVPVIQGNRNDRIMDKLINNDQKWQEKHRRTLAEHCYRGAPFFDRFGQDFLRLYDTEWERLIDLSMASTRFLLTGFGITTPIVLASDLGDFPGQKSELLAQICAKVGADVMLSGDGARDYVDQGLFQKYGIEVEWQNFQHPEYPQPARGKGEFLPRVAALDLLLNVGPDGLGLLRAARAPTAGA